MSVDIPKAPSRNGRTIWLTRDEYAMLDECRHLVMGFTKSKMSWGVFLLSLAIGGVSIKAINGVLIRCPECEHEVEMKLVNPRIALASRNRKTG